MLQGAAGDVHAAAITVAAGGGAVHRDHHVIGGRQVVQVEPLILRQRNRCGLGRGSGCGGCGGRRGCRDLRVFLRRHGSIVIRRDKLVQHSLRILLHLLHHAGQVAQKRQIAQNPAAQKQQRAQTQGGNQQKSHQAKQHNQQRRGLFHHGGLVVRFGQIFLLRRFRRSRRHVGGFIARTALLRRSVGLPGRGVGCLRRSLYRPGRSVSLLLRFFRRFWRGVNLLRRRLHRFGRGVGCLPRGLHLLRRNNRLRLFGRRFPAGLRFPLDVGNALDLHPGLRLSGRFQLRILPDRLQRLYRRHGFRGLGRDRRCRRSRLRGRCSIRQAGTAFHAEFLGFHLGGRTAIGANFHQETPPSREGPPRRRGRTTPT